MANQRAINHEPPSSRCWQSRREEVKKHSQTQIPIPQILRTYGPSTSAGHHATNERNASKSEDAISRKRLFLIFM